MFVLFLDKYQELLISDKKLNLLVLETCNTITEFVSQERNHKISLKHLLHTTMLNMYINFWKCIHKLYNMYIHDPALSTHRSHVHPNPMVKQLIKWIKKILPEKCWCTIEIILLISRDAFLFKCWIRSFVIWSYVEIVAVIKFKFIYSTKLLNFITY